MATHELPRSAGHVFYEKLNELLAEAGFDGQVEHLVQLQSRIAEKLRAEILVKPQVELVPPATLPVSEGKAQRVVDRRQK